MVRWSGNLQKVTLSTILKDEHRTVKLTAIRKAFRTKVTKAVSGKTVAVL
jgi:hypothetical protein